MSMEVEFGAYHLQTVEWCKHQRGRLHSDKEEEEGVALEGRDRHHLQLEAGERGNGRTTIAKRAW